MQSGDQEALKKLVVEVKKSAEDVAVKPKASIKALTVDPPL